MPPAAGGASPPGPPDRQGAGAGCGFELFAAQKSQNRGYYLCVYWLYRQYLPPEATRSGSKDEVPLSSKTLCARSARLPEMRLQIRPRSAQGLPPDRADGFTTAGFFTRLALGCVYQFIGLINETPPRDVTDRSRILSFTVFASSQTTSAPPVRRRRPRR